VAASTCSLSWRGNLLSSNWLRQLAAAVIVREDALSRFSLFFSQSFF